MWPDVLRLTRDYGIKAQAMGTIWGVDPDTVKGIGEAADGFIGIVPHTLQVKGNNKPTIKAVDAALTKRDAAYPGYGGIGYMSGWAFVLMLREVFARTIKAGKPLDGTNLFEQLAGLKDWDSGGIFGAPVSVVKQAVPFGTSLQIQRQEQPGHARSARRRRARGRLIVAEPVLELSDLSVVYAGGVQGLASLSLKVPPGSVVALLGSNGAGKSTTLKAISNLLPFEGGKVAQGSIRFEGRDIVGIAAHRLARSACCMCAKAGASSRP